MFKICDITHLIDKITLNSMVPLVIALIRQNLDIFKLKVEPFCTCSYEKVWKMYSFCLFAELNAVFNQWKSKWLIEKSFLFFMVYCEIALDEQKMKLFEYLYSKTWLLLLFNLKRVTTCIGSYIHHSRAVSPLWTYQLEGEPLNKEY